MRPVKSKTAFVSCRLVVYPVVIALISREIIDHKNTVYSPEDAVLEETEEASEIRQVTGGRIKNEAHDQAT